MEELKEIRNAITTLLLENKFLKNLDYEKDLMINDLTSRIEELEYDLNCAKANGFIKTKKLTLPKV